MRHHQIFYHQIFYRQIFYRQIFSALAMLSLLLTSAPAHAAPPSQQAETTLRQCNDVAEDTLLDELNTVSQQVFAAALTDIDVAGIVDDQWSVLAVDGVIDSAVDSAVVQVTNDTDLWTKFLSGWSADQAKELATAVASKAFDSEPFRKKLEEISVAVATEIGAKVGELSAQSVSAAFYCLQTFIGGNYAGVLVDSFEERVQNAIGADESVVKNNQLDSGVLAILDQHKVALGGVGVIIAAQITRRLLVELGETIAKRVAGKIVGRILGRVGSELVPIAGWIIGTGLIVYDVYSSREGALPEIQDALKSAEVKAGIRSEVVASIQPELELQLPEMARSIANDLFSQWRETKRDIRQVLDLSASNLQFDAILQGIETQDQLAKLVNLVGAILSTQGRPALDSAISDGSLSRALSLPASAPQLVEALGSLPDALAWGDLAGELVEQVVALEIYKHKKPSDFERSTLEKLIAVGDKAAVSNLVLLDNQALASVLTISTDALKTVATQLTPDQLTWLGSTVAGLSQTQVNQLLARLVSNPQIITQLQGNNLLAQISDGDDLDQVLTFVAGPSDLPAWGADTLRVLQGSVPPVLFAGKYGWLTTVATALAVLLIVLIGLRLIYSFGAWLLRPLTGWRRG